MSPNQPSIDELMAQRDWVAQVARRLLDDVSAAEDAAQDALVKATRSPPTLDPERNRVGALRGWLRTVVTNVVRDAKRIEARRKRREFAARLRELEPAVLDVVERASSQRRVVEAVMSLQEPYRKTILLRFFDDHSPKQIAEELRIPINTVNSRLQRGLERLRSDLEREFGGNRRAFAVWLLPLTGRASGVLGGLAVLAVAHRMMLGKIALLAFSGVVAHTLWWDAVRGQGPTSVALAPDAGEQSTDRVERKTEWKDRQPDPDNRRVPQADLEAAWKQYLARAGVDVELPFSPSAILMERTGSQEIVTIPGMIQLPRGRVAEDFEALGVGKQRQSMKRFPGAFIDRTEVTRGQWRVFLDSNPFGAETAAARERFESTPGSDQLPVTNIDFGEATIYARWAFKSVQSYAEWRFAGSGGDDRRFPFGETLRAHLLRHSANGPIEVGKCSTLAAPFPVADLVGNVAEWTRDVGLRADGVGRSMRNDWWRVRSNRVVGGAWSDSIAIEDGKAFALGSPQQEPVEFRSSEIGLRCTRALNPYPDYLRDGLADAGKSPDGWIDVCEGARGVEAREFSGEIQTAARVFAFTALPDFDDAICLIRTNVPLRSPLAGTGVFVVRRTSGRYYLHAGVRRDDDHALSLLHEALNERTGESPRLLLDRISEGRVAIELDVTEGTEVRRVVLPFYVDPKDLADAKPQIPIQDDLGPMLETLQATRVGGLKPSAIEWMARAWLSSHPDFVAQSNLVDLLKRGLENPVHANSRPYTRDVESFAKLMRIEPEMQVAKNRRTIDLLHGTNTAVRFELAQSIEHLPGMRPLIVDLDGMSGRPASLPLIRNYHTIVVPRATSATSWLDAENRTRLFAAIRATTDSFEADPQRIYLRASGAAAIEALELVRQHPGIFAGCMLQAVSGDVEFPAVTARGFWGRTIVLEHDHGCPGIASLRTEGVNVLVVESTIEAFLAEDSSVSRLTTRAPYPEKFSFTTYGRAARCANYIELTRLDPPGPFGATLTVETSFAKNRIEISHDAAIGSLRIWLNDQILDLDREFTVVLTKPGEPSRTARYKVERSSLVLLDSMKAGACANLGAMFTTFIEVE